MEIIQSVTTLPAVPLTAEYWRARGTFLARLYDEHGPVVRALLGRTEVVFLLGPEANRFVLRTHRRSFSQREGWDWVFGRPATPPNLLTMDDPQHAWHRRLLHPAFAARRMAGYLPLIARAIDRRLATWAARGVVDVYEEARVITFDVAAAILGLRAPADLALCRAVYLHGAHRRADELSGLFRRAIDERRVRPADDALGLLAGGRDEEGRLLDDAQILAHADVILIAGHETSASLAAWALYLLVRHPIYERRVLDDLARFAPGGASELVVSRNMGTLDRAVSEAERLYPPVSIAPRVVAAEVTFDGYTLPPGTRVFYSAAATHALPGVWSDPTRFDPDRFAPPREEHKRTPYALAGFGGGPRVCIGRSVARVEVALFLARALSRYQLTVEPGQTIAQRDGVTSRPLHGIRMRARPRPALA